MRIGNLLVRACRQFRTCRILFPRYRFHLWQGWGRLDSACRRLERARQPVKGGGGTGDGFRERSGPHAEREEYVADHAGSEEYSGLRAVDPRAVDRIDLLTVVEHELGHIVGRGNLDAALDDVMKRSKIKKRTGRALDFYSLLPSIVCPSLRLPRQRCVCKSMA